ncbi:DmsC/YnfH family molybdoenzyme membrane anchor subunit [Neomoorella humiferrea]|nr:DmsC/YnfH family molybdoenzyme membrane anchor subunit [Moorella humiferrea]
MAAGMLISLGHLGSPLGAPRAILNLKSSWLSREIFFAAWFFVLWALNYVLETRSQASDGIKATTGWLASLCGVVAPGSLLMAGKGFCFYNLWNEGCRTFP